MVQKTPSTQEDQQGSTEHECFVWGPKIPIGVPYKSVICGMYKALCPVIEITGVYNMKKILTQKKGGSVR